MELLQELPLTPWPILDMVLRLLIAVALGAVMGYEREHAEKPVGIRTNILVCVGATLFTIASIHGFGGLGDPSRVAAGIVIGIGFIGAGAIIRRQTGLVTGITTAATIWVVAGVGMAVGSGLYILAAVTAVITYITLRFFHRRPPPAEDK